MPLMQSPQSQQRRGALAATWILGAGLIGLLGDVTSIAGATVVVGFGLIPPILMLTMGWGRELVTCAARESSC